MYLIFFFFFGGGKLKAGALGIKCTERSHWGSSISVVKAPSSLFLLIYP